MPKAQSDWRNHAACLGADPERFFPLSAAGPGLAQLKQAKRICQGCRVRVQCLEFALEVGEIHGIWGGTSEDERRSLLARKRQSPDRGRDSGDGRAPAGRDRPLGTVRH
jgi:WhiB family transcriptional regulator, redox-sensing transcriptional regulator